MTKTHDVIFERLISSIEDSAAVLDLARKSSGLIIAVVSRCKNPVIVKIQGMTRNHLSKVATDQAVRQTYFNRDLTEQQVLG
jgi:exosome complex RNA-binding protein Csl4